MNVLIVDDNVDFCSTMSDIVQSQSWNSHMLHTPEEALQYLELNHPSIDLLLLDIEFDHRSAMNGLDILAHSVKKYPSIPVIMISGKGTIETAVRATKLGALNFIEKSSLSHDHLIQVLSSAAERIQGASQNQEFMKIIQEQGLIGNSKAMQSVADKIIRYGRTELSVLITGETGTGKKLVAKAIHALSKRNKHPFVTVDIPNIPRELFQSELFGHLRGAFSGAMQDKKGLFHQADKGSLFLDEIGDLPAESQAYLLLPLEEKTLRRVGSLDSEAVNIRFIAATDKDLVSAMNNGAFREQLYHRLRECEINLPALSERREDIPVIADYYVRKHNEQLQEHKFLSHSAIEFLGNYDWKGNVRELASALRVTLQTCAQDQIEISDLQTITKSSAPTTGKQSNILSLDRTRKEDLERVDKIKIEQILSTCKGNVSKAAAMLAISRETLHIKIRKYEIDVQALRAKA